MTLSMRDGGPRDLPRGDNVISTGQLGYCSAVVVIWGGFDRNGYTHVRGWHGNGGVEAINFHQLLNGVHHDDHDARIIFVPGIAYQRVPREALQQVQQFEQRLPALFRQGNRRCKIQCLSPQIEVSFDRRGNLL